MTHRTARIPPLCHDLLWPVDSWRRPPVVCRRGRHCAGRRPASHGSKGQPLNLDFESGDLRDWQATGNAFAGQPVKDDTVHARRADMRSNHVGNFWLGTYEVAGDKVQGTLTSRAFRVTRPFASFLVAGGSNPTLRVEIVRDDSKKIIYQVSGDDTEHLKPVVVDLTAHVGQDVFVRLVDESSAGWGHLNFDDFRLHDAKPDIPDRAGPQPLDVYVHAGLDPRPPPRR